MKYPQRDGGAGGWKGGKKFGTSSPWKSRSTDRGSDRPMMHPATCSKCGNRCEVPFKPNGKKPIFCSNCFVKDEGGESRRESGRFGGGVSRFGGAGSRFERPAFDERRIHQATCEKCGKSCTVPFKPTGRKPVFCSDCFGGESPAATRTGGDASYEKQFKVVNTKLDAIIKLLSAKDSLDDVL